MKAYEEVEVWLYSFLTSTVNGGEWSASRPGRFVPEKTAPNILGVGDSLGFRVGLDALDKRNIFCPLLEFNHESSVVRPVVLSL